MLPKVCEWIVIAFTKNHWILYPFKFYSNFTNKNVSWLHFSWATQYIAQTSNLRLNLLQLSPQSPSDPWGLMTLLGAKAQLAPPPVEPGLSVCLSVRLSRWCIVSTRLKISSDFLFGQVAPSLEFFTPCTDTQFQGEPIQRGRKIHGVGKLAIFDWNCPYLGNGAR